jgi:hypothetical protein
MTKTRIENWFVKNGEVAFQACFEIIEDDIASGTCVAAQYGSREEAQAHVDRAIRNNVERDEKDALCKHLFNKENWKLPTSCEICDDAIKAGAIYDALGYFCGGAEMRQLPNGKFSVGSLGYYHYIGA